MNGKGNANATRGEAFDAVLANEKFDFPAEEIANENDGDEHRRIEALAYAKAQSRGFVEGRELDDWLEAEQEVRRTDGNSPTT